MALDNLASRHGLTGVRSKFHSAILQGSIAQRTCLLAQPMTFMNRSGSAVLEALQFYKLDPATDLLVAVDDTALPLGQIRLRGEGSSGGHNGLSDIERILGTRKYGRLRIGVGPSGRVPHADFVLGRFTSDQLAQLSPVLDRTCDAIECWLNDGMAQAMNRYNVAATEND